jgi:hypothetical protein
MVFKCYSAYEKHVENKIVPCVSLDPRCEGLFSSEVIAQWIITWTLGECLCLVFSSSIFTWRKNLCANQISKWVRAVSCGVYVWKRKYVIFSPNNLTYPDTISFNDKNISHNNAIIIDFILHLVFYCWCSGTTAVKTVTGTAKQNMKNTPNNRPQK